MLAVAKRIAARTPSYATYVRERPGWAVLFLFGRLNWARKIERRLRARRRVATDLPHSDDVRSPDAAALARHLATDGVCEGLSLRPETLAEIRHFADENHCAPRDEADLRFLARNIEQANRERRKDMLAAYYFSSVERCDAITRLRSDPRLLSAARNYLGQEAKNIRVRLWWSFPARRFDDMDLRGAAQDRFHFDLNDWRTVKFFFYLTDVDGDSGPHVYVRGSHRDRSVRHQYTIFHGKEKADLERYYDAAAFRTITGPAGSGFAEDPFVFHTGSTARSSPRLILELEFGPYDPSPSYRYGELG